MIAPPFVKTPSMVATVILGMLCVHLLCFCVMFHLISTRLHGKKMGMEVFALGNLLLGTAYILQLFSGASDSGPVSIFNHTFTLCAPVLYVLGALRFFKRSPPVWLPLLVIAGLYTTTQLAVQWHWGPVARHAMLSACCTLLFFGMSATALYGIRTFAKDLRIEMCIFAAFIAGIAVLNAAKFWIIWHGGLAALDMRSQFQTVFYIYMCFLGTVLPPSMVWLVLKRLTDELSNMASIDPLTGLLNRRGLVHCLESYFRSRTATPAYLLMVDVDHFKQINDTYGHKVGDLVLSNVAHTIQSSTRHGDLTCRAGGEEFMVICLDTDGAGAMQVAERIRAAIAHHPVSIGSVNHTICCSATIGISLSFADAQSLDTSMIQADAALYRGKAAGRNQVVFSDPRPPSTAPATLGFVPEVKVEMA